MSENTTDVSNQNQTVSNYTLDGHPTTLLELNEARSKPGIRIKEEAPGVYKTLQRLNG